MAFGSALAGAIGVALSADLSGNRAVTSATGGGGSGSGSGRGASATGSVVRTTGGTGRSLEYDDAK